MRSEEFERQNKYLVLKWDDLMKYLTNEERDTLYHFVTKVGSRRVLDHKDPFPRYVVVNEEEPYAEKVWELIEEGWLNDKGEK